MAYTIVRTPAVLGNKRAYLLDITADAATQTIETGLSVVEGVSIAQQSCTTAGIKCYANSNASGIQSFGVVGLSGLASGDELFVTVFGH